MNKILVFILLFCCAGAYAQNPVIINQPYDFQKWVRVKDSIRASRGFFPDSLLAPKNWTKKINDTSIVVGRDTLINISNPKKDIDVFLVAGQSNAKGKGDSTLSPRVISGKVLQINTGVITDANDPVGQDVPGSNERSQYGSAWPSFGNTYYNRTSRLICMVPSYKGGTSQCAAADVGNGNWDTTGVLFDSAVARVKNSMTVLASNGYNPIFKGVVWLQGESDGIGIQNGTITQTDYINAFKKMIRKFRVNFGASMPFYIIRIGATTAYVDANWKLIRDAQQTVANADSSTQIVFYNAANFVARGLMQGDGVHFNQVGLNEVGQLTANAVLNHNKNIWQPQAGSLYYANTGTLAIGGPPTEDYDLEINTSKNNSHGGMKILNSSNGTGAFSAIKMYTDAGNSGFIFTSSSTNTVYGPNIFTIYSAFSGGLRLGANTGDIVFGQLAQGNAGNSYARYVVGSGNYLYNTATDVPANGKFQINSTSWFNGLMKLNSIISPPSTYNVLVHGLSDSGTYQVPVSGLATNNFFNADLSATGNRSHNFKGFNLTIDSLKDYKLFSKGSFFGTPVRSSYQILPNTPSSGLLLTYAFSKTDLSGDSVSVYLSGTPNNIDLGAADISNNHNSVVRVSNSGTGKASIMLQTDSLSASMQPRSTYDSLVVVGTYNSGTKTNPIGKASLSDVRGYKIYNALLSQSGTSDPTATVLGGNQVGAIVWTRAGLGAYTGTLSGAFTTAKTFILVGQNADGITANCFRSDANTVTLKTYLTSTGGSTDVFTDLSLEIRVYP